MKSSLYTAASAAAVLGAASHLEFGRKDGSGGASPSEIARLGGELNVALREVKSYAERVKGEFQAMDDRVGNLEQKAARGGGHGGGGAAQSPGQMFVASDEVKSLLGNVRGGQRVGIQVKAVITSATADADGSAGAWLSPHRDLIAPLAKRPPSIRSLLTVIPVTTNSVEFPRQTGRTIGAATVAEGALKPQSELKFDMETVPIRTIAHWVLASRQILDDAPQLQGFIDSELRYGLQYVEDNQLLNGAGTGTDLEGIYTQATAFSHAATGLPVMSNVNKIDIIAAAILQCALANEPATGIVLHPSDWMSMRMIKDADGHYLLGDPGAAIEPRLFNLPVVPTQAQTIDKFLVGNFAAATLYDRMEARVEVSTEDSDNFRKNLVTVLGEERVGLAVKRTTAFVKGDFSDAEADMEA